MGDSGTINSTLAQSRDVMSLRLKKTGTYYGQTINENDYVVLDGNGLVVGRIFLAPRLPDRRDWVWSITDPEKPTSVHNHGRSATLEKAIADFGARWRIWPD